MSNQNETDPKPKAAASGVDVDALVRDFFEDDGAPKKCPKCGSTTITEKVMGAVDLFYGTGPTCEAEYFCECGECVGFWAYGYWHPDYRDAFISNATHEPRNQ